MRAVKLWIALFWIAGTLAFGQAVDKSLTFDVASVKPAAPPVPDSRGRIMIAGPSGGPGSKDPGRIRYPFMNLRSLLTIAYDVKGYQIAGPATLDTERFEITATMPPTTTKEQFQVMLQNLLAERFKLTLHRETKELPVYSLVLAKSGSKLKESAETAPPAELEPGALPPLPPGGPKMGPDGFPIMPAGMAAPGGQMMIMMMPGRARLFGQHQPLQNLVARLSQQLNRPVIDATGLTGKYDITLTYATEGLGGGPFGSLLGPPPPPPGGGAAGPAGNANVVVPEGETPPDIFAAVQSQLGLKLESKKGPVEMLVIDHVEKTPTEN